MSALVCSTARLLLTGCNPFIVEFIYFFGHMDGGLNTNVIMLTEAEKSPVSLKPLWLQLTSVVKLRELFLC